MQRAIEYNYRDAIAPSAPLAPDAPIRILDARDPVAQLDSAPDSESGGCEFESRRDRQVEVAMTGKPEDVPCGEIAISKGMIEAGANVLREKGELAHYWSAILAREVFEVMLAEMKRERQS